MCIKRGRLDQIFLLVDLDLRVRGREGGLKQKQMLTPHQKSVYCMSTIDGNVDLCEYYRMRN